MESKLYVGNLSYAVSENDLRQLFGQVGEIKDVALVVDRDTRRPRGFGFVEMTTAPDAQKAIEMFNDYELDGRRIKVSIARPREDHSDGNRRSFSNRGGGGGRRRY